MDYRITSNGTLRATAGTPQDAALIVQAFLYIYRSMVIVHYCTRSVSFLPDLYEAVTVSRNRRIEADIDDYLNNPIRALGRDLYMGEQVEKGWNAAVAGKRWAQLSDTEKQSWFDRAAQQEENGNA